MPDQHKKGFTLPELMVGLLAFSILSLSMGLMLIQGWKVWYSSNDSVSMQRDTALALSVIRKEIRCSKLDDLIVSGNRIDFPATGVRQSTGAESIYRFGSNLIHNGPDGEFPLVNGNLVAFSAAKGLKSISISLTCQTEPGIDDVQTITVYTRN